MLPPGSGIGSLRSEVGGRLLFMIYFFTFLKFFTIRCVTHEKRKLKPKPKPKSTTYYSCQEHLSSQVIFGKTLWSKVRGGICFHTLGCGTPASHSPGAQRLQSSGFHRHCPHRRGIPYFPSKSNHKPYPAETAGSLGRRASLSEPASGWTPEAI